jgi:phage terminase large subunit
MDYKVSPIFIKNLQSKAKITVNQGGTRSGKTYSLCQLMALYWLKKAKGWTISIVRKELNTARTTVMKDFIEILENVGMWDEANWSKSNLTYKYNGNTVEFIGMDKASKKRGAKRNILYINEANELSYEDWFQLLIRTTDRVYIDYNPSDEYHWIYDKVLTRDDCTFIQSTYLDNYDFLPPALIAEIERIKEQDEEYWKVYGLGERASSSNTIYSKWEFCTEKDIEKAILMGGTITYGLDFGFNHPNALVRVVEYDNNCYVSQLLYKSGLTTADLIQELKGAGLAKDDEIWADAARPDTIEEISKHGFNIKAADKSVHDGILTVKSKKLFIDNNSADLLKEIKAYKWKTNNTGENLDVPVKLWDDALDAMRYAIYNNHLQGMKGVQRASFGFKNKKRR